MSLEESLLMCVELVCHRYGIENYSINEDGSVDVEGDVDIRRKGLTELPLQFRNVKGSFYCSYNPNLSEEELSNYLKRIKK